MPQLRRDDSDRFFDYSLHIPTRTIHLGGEVDDEMAEFFLKAMHLLSSSTAPIKVILNSIGGDEYHGFAIYDAIACSESHVTVVMYGNAMSMGSIIPQAADDRVIAPHCCMMIHVGTWGHEENAHTAIAQAKENERILRLMEDIYLKRIHEKVPGFTRARVKRMLIDETYLTADRAVELGLADRVM